MHPPRTNARSINIEIEYSCELSHANGRSMKGENSEKSKNPVSGFRTGDDVIRSLASCLLSHIEPYGIPCALGLKKPLLEMAAQPRIIGSEKRRTVTTVGFEPATVTLKSDPCPGEHSTSSSADERALSPQNSSYAAHPSQLRALVKGWRQLLQRFQLIDSNNHCTHNHQLTANAKIQRQLLQRL